MVVSLDRVEKNYRYLCEKLPRVKVFYAIKANSEPAILQRMAALGSNFGVASIGEIRLLASLGVPGSRMIYANPVKPAWDIAEAAKLGVDRFTFDDESEIEKMAAGAPGAQVLVRVQVENDSAVVNLNEKFGVVPDKAVSLLHKAKEAGLVPAGICFHVGSQSLKSEAYGRALTLCRRLFDEAEQQGMKLEMYLQYANTDINKLRETYKDTAAINVKTDLVLEAVAKAEGIKVEAEELDAEVESMAKAYGATAAEVKKIITQQGRTVDLVETVLRRKTAQMILDSVAE